MPVIKIAATGPTLTISDLPTGADAASVSAVNISVQIMLGKNRTTIQWGESPRQDIASPTMTVDLTSLPATPHAYKEDFKPDMQVHLFVKEVDATGKKLPGGVEGDTTYSGTDIMSIMVKNPNMPQTRPSPQPRNLGGGHGSSGHAAPGAQAGSGGGGGNPPANPNQALIDAINAQTAQSTAQTKQFVEAILAARSSGGGSGSANTGASAGNAVAPTPVQAPVPDNNFRWWLSVIVLVIVFLIAAGAWCYSAWLRETIPVNPNVPPATIKVSLDASSLNLKSGRPSMTAPATVLKGIAIVETTAASNNGPKAAAKDDGEWSTVGDKIVRPQTASLKTVCPASSPAPREVVTQYAAPVYMETQSWGTQGSVSLGYHVGSYRCGYSAPVQVCAPPTIEVTRVHTQRGSGYVLTSSPALGVSKDLVRNGTAFQVASSYHGAYKSGRR